MFNSYVDMGNICYKMYKEYKNHHYRSLKICLNNLFVFGSMMARWGPMVLTWISRFCYLLILISEWTIYNKNMSNIIASYWLNASKLRVCTKNKQLWVTSVHLWIFTFLYIKFYQPDFGVHHSICLSWCHWSTKFTKRL